METIRMVETAALKMRVIMKDMIAALKKYL